MMHDGKSGETSETGLVDGGHRLYNLAFRIAESAFYSMPHAKSHISHLASLGAAYRKESKDNDSRS